MQILSYLLFWKGLTSISETKIIPRLLEVFSGILKRRLVHKTNSDSFFREKNFAEPLENIFSILEMNPKSLSLSL